MVSRSPPLFNTSPSLGPPLPLLSFSLSPSVQQPRLPSPMPSYYLGENVRPVAPADDDLSPQHQPLAPNGVAFGAQGSEGVEWDRLPCDSTRDRDLFINNGFVHEADNAEGNGAGGDSRADTIASIMDVDYQNALPAAADYGSANHGAVDMDVDDKNPAVAGASSWTGGDYEFLKMLMDEPGERSYLSLAVAATSSDPDAGAPPVMDVEEVCRLVDRQKGLEWDGAMSEVNHSS